MRRLHDSGFSPDATASRGPMDLKWGQMDPEDELMHLLDLIAAKSEKLKSERGLQAISEDSVSEVEQLRRERLLLLQRVAELESAGTISGQSSSSRKEQEAESESSISGIVHSVHIRTGQELGSAVVPSVTQQQNLKKSSRSISQSDLSQNSVHIEIKNMSKSQDQLSKSRRKSSSTSPTVSVVSLKHASVDNLPAQLSKTRYLSPNKSGGLFGTGSVSKSQILSRPALPGRMVMGIKAKNNPKLKSHSVENLIDPSSTVLGLKPANSEMNMVQIGGRRRLSGTTSELNMNRIGTSEKVKVFENLEGVTSLPAELQNRQGLKIKPNRDKIRTILGMTNIIELQRHLLTTVMENEVS